MEGKIKWDSTEGEIRNGSIKYVEALIEELDKIGPGNILDTAKEILFMGFATGVIAGKLSDFGVDGLTLLLNGIRISLDAEDRKEMLQFAIWDKEGDLHTSEELEMDKNLRRTE